MLSIDLLTFSQDLASTKQELPIQTTRTHLDEVFRLVEESERGVPGAVGAERHDVLQLLQAVPQVRPTVLLKLVVGRPANWKM